MRSHTLISVPENVTTIELSLATRILSISPSFTFHRKFYWFNNFYVTVKIKEITNQKKTITQLTFQGKWNHSKVPLF